MNKVKKIYYPILAALFVIALILGFVISSVSLGAKADKTFTDSVRNKMEIFASDGDEHNSFNPTAQENIRLDIETTLEKAGIAEARGSEDSGYSNATADKPTYIRQEVTLNRDTLDHLASNEDELFYAAKELVNYVVIFPGKSEEAVLFTANYDTAVGSQSGTETMQAVAMLQTVENLAAKTEYKPDKTLVFVFTDCEREGAFGAYAFRYQFKGFNNVASKVSLAVNFGAKGTGMLAVESDKLSVSGVRTFASGLNNAIDDIYDGISDYDAYEGVPRINVFFTGNREYLDTARDTMKNVSDSKIAEIGGVLDSFIEGYSKGSIPTTEDKGMFSYFGFALQYKNTDSYLLGAIAIVLLFVALFELIRNGKKPVGLIRGFFAQLAAVVISTLILYVFYFVIVLLLAGFGTLSIRALTTVMYMNLGIFIFSLILAFAAYVGVFLVLRRFYKVKATEAARGGALLIMLLGIVMAFAMPSASFVFVFTAMLEGLMLILIAELSRMFKNKYGADMERLFLYTLPLIILTPIMIPVLVLAAQSLPAIYFPLILLVAIIGMSVIAPYFGNLKPMLSAAVAKLPKHTIRIERVVTEKVEGPKKGRFQEVTHKKVETEKVQWNYHNRYAVMLIGFLSALVIILFAVCPANQYSSNIYDTYSYRESVKDNSIVYVWDQQGLNSNTENLYVYDKAAYGYISRVDNEFEWDDVVGAYRKTFLGSSSSFLGTIAPFDIKTTGDDKASLEFITFDYAADSIIDVTLTNMEDVTKLTIQTDNNPIEIENNGKSTVRLQFPYDENVYGSFTIKFEFQGGVNVGVDYSQYVTGARAIQRMNTLSDYSDVISAFSDKSFRDEIKCGMIFHKQNSYSLG